MPNCAHPDCKLPFLLTKVNRIYCSHLCKSNANRTRRVTATATKKPCRYCGIKFKTHDGRRAYCSPACNTASRLRWQRDYEARERERARQGVVQVVTLVSCPKCRAYGTDTLGRSVHSNWCDRS